MRLITRAITAEDIREIAGWRYAAPYDVYNDSAPEDASAYRVLCDDAGTLCGFFCWGGEARIAAAADLYAQSPAALDFGMGLAPALTGCGIGLFAASAALQWLQDAFAPAEIRLAVYEWNKRAQHVYRRAGFVPLASRGDFLLMTLDARPWRDASRPLENGMPIYPFDPGFDRHLHYHKEDTGWDMSVFSMSAHTGTHVDAPAHIGLPGDTDGLSLARLNGAVQLLDWRQDAQAPVHAPHVLIRLGGRGFTPEEARRLLDMGVTMVGVDGMSVGEGETEWKVHEMLLAQGVTVLENAMLDGFAPGWYEMRCLPLRMPGSDGAPVRLLLREMLP